MAAQQASQVDGNALREVMRRVPAPVVVVTVAEGERRRGITIGSMTSVSLEPSLVAFNVQKEAETHDMLLATGRFAVNVLTEDQAELAHHFSIPDRCGPEQFDAVPHAVNREGLPILDGALAILLCSVQGVHDVSDHSVIIATVDDIPHQDLKAFPLIYFDQSYRGVGSEVKSTAFSPTNRGSSDSS